MGALEGVSVGVLVGEAVGVIEGVPVGAFVGAALGNVGAFVGVGGIAGSGTHLPVDMFTTLPVP